LSCCLKKKKEGKKIPSYLKEWILLLKLGFWFVKYLLQR
jgi:hypothetical protein